MSAPALELHNIHRRFGATVALAGAHCVIAPGTVHALLGENGAGKTTLMRIAFGMLAADQGELRMGGRPLCIKSERDAIAAGIGMVHQHFMLVPAFTVAENAALGGRGRFDSLKAAEAVRRIGAESGLVVDPNARVADLTVGAQQRAEIVRALAQNARILILDEPTAVLTPSESDELYRWMRRFVATGGSVVLITHKLREALAVADDVTVLRRGVTVLGGPRATLHEDDVLRAIVGDVSDPASSSSPLPASDGDVLFSLDEAEYRDALGVQRLQPTTLTVRRGEILGVLGVEGSGQREFLRLCAGRLAPTDGRIQRPDSVGFVPEDRLHDAVIDAFTLSENHALASAAALRGLVPWAHVVESTAALLSDFDVRAAGPDVPLRTLSGGNQQRFVVARERQKSPQALVAENPTRGLDVQATARVLRAIRAVAAERNGAAIVYSTDMDEVLALTKRVVVFYAGLPYEVPPPADPNDRGPYARALVGALT